MKMLCLCFLTLITFMKILVHSLPLGASDLPADPHPGPSEDDWAFAEAYLKHFYGYKPKMERRKRAADARADVDWSTGLCDKVKEMQHFFGLPQSGELTAETLVVMKRPRCGLSDVELFGETIRWKKRQLSYRIAGHQFPISVSQVHKAFRAAWKIWSNVTPMHFRKRRRREADIVISFHSGGEIKTPVKCSDRQEVLGVDGFPDATCVSDHYDGSPFDGKLGVLAHAFLPGSGIGGDVHFDADEDWSFNSTGTGVGESFTLWM